MSSGALRDRSQWCLTMNSCETCNNLASLFDLDWHLPHIVSALILYWHVRSDGVSKWQSSSNMKTQLASLWYFFYLFIWAAVPKFCLECYISTKNSSCPPSTFQKNSCQIQIWLSDHPLLVHVSTRIAVPRTLPEWISSNSLMGPKRQAHIKPSHSDNFRASQHHPLVKSMYTLTLAYTVTTWEKETSPLAWPYQIPFHGRQLGTDCRHLCKTTMRVIFGLEPTKSIRQLIQGSTSMSFLFKTKSPRASGFPPTSPIRLARLAYVPIL